MLKVHTNSTSLEACVPDIIELTEILMSLSILLYCMNVKLCCAVVERYLFFKSQQLNI